MDATQRANVSTALRSFATYPLGQIVVANMYIGARDSHVSLSIIEAILVDFASRHSNTLSDEEAYLLLMEIIRSHFDEFAFQRSPVPKFPAQLTTVLSLERMKGEKGILDEDAADDALLATITGRMNEDAFRFLAAGLQTGGPYLRDDSLFGERWGIFWASAPDTRSEDVEEAWHRHSPGASLACRVRDWLGLTHYSKEAALFEFTVRGTAVTGAGPTFVEAQDHCRFKAVADTPAGEGWGMATDLSKLNPVRTDIDGGQEIVLRAVSISNTEKCRWLGFPRTDDTSSHAEFAEYLLGTKGWDGIVNELVEL